MARFRTASALGAAAVFGALAMAAQTLLLRRFLWRFEAAEAGVALFLASWLFWSGAGAAAAGTRAGQRVTAWLAKAVWLPVLACAGLYAVQYALLENLRLWMGVPEYLEFPLLHLVAGCLLANAPFCFAAGFVVPSVCRRLDREGEPASRAFAWEALGAAAGGLALTALLCQGVAPDPRDEAEWRRYFPQAEGCPGRIETGGGTTFHGSHGGTFYALSSSGVSEAIPGGERPLELAELALSQRPYAQSALLLGAVPLAAGLALEAVRPDLEILWCPCDPRYGAGVLAAVRQSGVQTRVRAAGDTPQRLLERLWLSGVAFDVVLVGAPPATSLEGASWRLEAFARRVRRVTRRTGVALFGIACEAAALTPEKRALLDAQVRAVRQAWPESGVFAAGAGGWWIAAQVPRLAYGPEEAVERFAMLKRPQYPAEALALIYDAGRAARLAEQCRALASGAPAAQPVSAGLEETLALGLADAVRRAQPGLAPAAWLERARLLDVRRFAGLLAVALWMVPVVLAGKGRAPLRLLGAWVAASGALGLAASLAALYRLQLAFGSLYLLAGAGSCLYLAGLFCGNRLSAAAAGRLRARRPWRALALPAASVLQAAAALAGLAAAEHLATETELLLLCFAAGGAAGLAVPLAFAACEDDVSLSAPVFVFSDAAGAAVAGLFVILLVPLAGLGASVAVFALLACGVSLCAAVSGPHARLTAGLALAVALIAAAGQLRDGQAGGAPAVGVPAARPERVAGGAPPADGMRDGLPGVPRKLDVPRIRDQLRRGLLATNEAACWE